MADYRKPKHSLNVPVVLWGRSFLDGFHSRIPYLSQQRVARMEPGDPDGWAVYSCLDSQDEDSGAESNDLDGGAARDDLRVVWKEFQWLISFAFL